MAVNVYIPTPFRRLTGNRDRVEVNGSTVGEVLQQLEGSFPGFDQMLRDGDKQIPSHINIYLNTREIHGLQGERTPVAYGDEVAVIPAIAGGAAAPLTADQVTRYSRHIIMPQVGP